MDSLAFRVPASDRLLEELPTRRVQTLIDYGTGEVSELNHGGRLALPAGLGWARVFADRRTGRPEMHVEVSGPNMLRGHNARGLEPYLVPHIVDTLLYLLDDLLPDVAKPETARLVRLDIVRDFLHVDSPSATLEAIARRPLAGATRHSEERDPLTGRLQTLTRGTSTQWLTRGYDKGVQLGQAAARERDADRGRVLTAWAEHSEGHLRFELELKAEWLRRNNMTKPDDLTHERATAVAERYFEQARYGDVLAGPTRLTQVLTALMDAGRGTEAKGVAAVLVGDLVGRPLHSRKQQQTYRALTRRLGLAAADMEGTGDAPRRLDFESGREIVSPESPD